MSHFIIRATPLSIKGDAEKRDYVNNIKFENLTFSGCRRVDWPKDRIAFQHDWDIYNLTNSLVCIKNAEKIFFDKCIFKNSGSNGFRADEHSIDIEVNNNDFFGLGANGILFSGDVPGGKDENHHNRIISNHIHHCGVLKLDSSGILVNQSGHNIISDNLVEFMPYNGITLISGREGVFEDEHRNDGSNGAYCTDRFHDNCPDEPIHKSKLYDMKFKHEYRS